MPFMNITPLRPEHVEPLARALYLQWHDFAPWSSMDKIRAYYAECLNGENLPLAFAAVGKDGALLGSAALKRHDMEEFSPNTNIGWAMCSFCPNTGGRAWAAC